MAAISKTPSGHYRGVFTSQPLDSVVDAVNNMTGNGTPQPITASTLSVGSYFAIAGTAIVSAGATQGNATQIVGSKAIVTTATASSKGVKLPVWATGREVIVINAGPTFGTKVWPATGAKIDAVATNGADGTALAANKITVYMAVGTNQWITQRGA